MNYHFSNRQCFKTNVKLYHIQKLNKYIFKNNVVIYIRALARAKVSCLSELGLADGRLKHTYLAQEIP